MIEPPKSHDEVARLASLHKRRVLDTPAEARFDRLTSIASLAFDVPICLVSLVDTDRQWFKSKVGLDVCETPRDISFCGHAILQHEPLVVTDALADPRFADNPLVVGEPRIRFYAGRPLADDEGRRLGTLCLIDRRPRSLTPSERELLEELGGLVEIELNSAGLDVTTSALRENEALYRSVVEALAEGVLVVDSAGRIEEANESAAVMLGLDLDNVVGRTLADLDAIPEFGFVTADGSKPKEDERPLIRTLRTGQGVHGHVMGLKRQNDETLWLSINTRAIGAGVDSTPQRAVLSFADITDRLQVERLKTEFVSMVSHELRTPLTSIRGALGLLAAGQTGHVDADGQRMLEIALSNSDRLIRLINDILDIERMESGRVSMDRQLTEFADVLGGAVEVMEPMAQEADVTLRLHASRAAVEVDADRMTQTLTNLISNAIKFSPPGELVEIWNDVGAASMTVHVSDRGRGVPRSEIDSIFDRFRQVDASDSRDKGGSGLGLAICKEIVEQHGGRIWATSHLGRGSRFSFRIPVESTRGSGSVGPARMSGVTSAAGVAAP